MKRLCKSTDIYGNEMLDSFDREISTGSDDEKIALRDLVYEKDGSCDLDELLFYESIADTACSVCDFTDFEDSVFRTEILGMPSDIYVPEDKFEKTLKLVNLKIRMFGEAILDELGISA